MSSSVNSKRCPTAVEDLTPSEVAKFYAARNKSSIQIRDIEMTELISKATAGDCICMYAHVINISTSSDCMHSIIYI